LAEKSQPPPLKGCAVTLAVLSTQAQSFNEQRLPILKALQVI